MKASQISKPSQTNNETSFLFPLYKARDRPLSRLPLMLLAALSLLLPLGKLMRSTTLTVGL